MWATPPNVDLKGLCRAHHIPFQRVDALDALVPALHSAWALAAPSVVEVVTDRSGNVETHRAIQAACTRAARRALHATGALPLAGPRANGVELGSGRANGHTAVAPGLARIGVIGSVRGGSDARRSVGRVEAGERTPDSGAWVVQALTIEEHNLPLAAPVTTDAAWDSHRHVGVLRVSLCHAGAVADAETENGRAAAAVRGVAEVSPLPGLHEETWQDALAQVAALSMLLRGRRVPADVALLEGQFARWWADVAGLSEASLLPSVRFAVECAIVGALARLQGRSLSTHIDICAFSGDPDTVYDERPADAVPGQRGDPDRPIGGLEGVTAAGAASTRCVVVNGLLDTAGKKAQSAASRARLLTQQGYTTLKVKVRVTLPLRCITA